MMLSFLSHRNTFLFIVLVLFTGTCTTAYCQSFRPFKNDLGVFDPDSGPVSMAYQLFEDVDQIEIKIVNFKGQVVNRYVEEALRAGDHSFQWDGSDSNGDRVPDGRYSFNFFIKFTNNLNEMEQVNVQVATLDNKVGVQVPAPLDAESYPHRIYGSLSSFYRTNNDSDENSGEVRLRTGFDYEKNGTSTKGTLQVIQNFDDSETTFNGSQFMIEQQILQGNIKTVYRDTLGSFDDPFQLYSDFKTENNKIGASFDQTFNNFKTVGLLFTSEGDVDSKEKGAAARISYGDQDGILIGTSITYRQVIEEFSDNILSDIEYTEDTVSSKAYATDIRYGLTDSFSLLGEVVATDSDSDGKDYGGGIKAELDFGALLFSAGYTNLGENFTADFADPLHHVDKDAKGFDGSFDYFMQRPVWHFSSFSASFRYFNLTRNSDGSKVEEIDGSFRLGINDKQTIFLSLYNRDDDFGVNSSYMANMTHKWNDTWSNLVQANYSETDSSESVRFSLTTNYTENENKGRLSLEWTRRTLEYSKFSPYNQSYLRFDLSNELWSLQLQAKYSENNEEDGVNLFGRVDCKPEFLHRYQIVTYLSLGNRSSIETEQQVEVGLEVQF